MSENTYRLDKSQFRMSKKSKDKTRSSDYWLTKTISERLRAANYLIAQAYGFDLDNPPRMDKTIFEMRKRP